MYSHDEFYDKDTECYFYSTDIRVENVSDMNEKIKEFQRDSWNNQLGDLVVFSHEWALDEEVKKDVEMLCEYAQRCDYRFEFFEDIP